MSKVLKKRRLRWIVGLSLVVAGGALLYGWVNRDSIDLFPLNRATSESAKKIEALSHQDQVVDSAASGAEGASSSIATEFQTCIHESLPRGGVEEWLTQIESPQTGGVVELEWLNYHFHSGTGNELRVRFENEGEFFRELKFGVDAEGLPVPLEGSSGDGKFSADQLQAEIAKIQEEQGMGPSFRQERKNIEFKSGVREGQVIVFTKENDEITDLAVTTAHARLQCQVDREDGTLPCYCQMY